MRTSFAYVMLLGIAVAAMAVQFSTPDQYIMEAYVLSQSGQIEQAIELMEEAISEFPLSSDVHTHMGILWSIQAQRAGGTQMYSLALKALQMWDQAIALNPNDVLARYNRGFWGIQAPFGYLDEGIGDLDYLTLTFEQTPDKVSSDSLSKIYDVLGMGYFKKGDVQNARQAWNKVIELAPGTGAAKSAAEHLGMLESFEEQRSRRAKQQVPESAATVAVKEKIRADPANPALRLELGKAYYNDGNYEKAVTMLKNVAKADQTNAEAYKWLALAMVEFTGQDYDDRTYFDQGFRTGLSFQTVRVANKAVELAPNDIDIRLIRGSVGVQMPFFVAILEESMNDLQMVIDSDAPDDMKAEALYWLGIAYEKKAASAWIDVISKYPSTNTVRGAFDAMHTPVAHFDVADHETPVLTVDFILGFRDELAPQTAIWVEDSDGKFVKTIYVSGFSGFAREKQVNLPDWAKSSKFTDVDAVTGASIDVGQHIYTWDLTNAEGKKVPSGEYTLNVEVAWWPSMEYQTVSGVIQVGKAYNRLLVKDETLVPYLEVKYYPK